MVWEVFSATDGVPVFRTRWRWMAYIVARMRGGDSDYEREGAGW